MPCASKNAHARAAAVHVHVRAGGVMLLVCIVCACLLHTQPGAEKVFDLVVWHVQSVLKV